MASALVALGANLGDRRQTLATALDQLRARPQISVLVASSFRETAPVGGPGGQGPFINAAVRFETSLAPHALHQLLAELETTLGRRRATRWEARAIDLDLLLYDELEIRTQSLVVPHPRMAFRRFVLEPSNEIAGGMMHPPTGWTISRLLAHLNTARPYVALLGRSASRLVELARGLAVHFRGRYVAGPYTLAVSSQNEPSGLDLGRQIELLRHAADLLAEQGWSEPDKLAISDFYFDQGLASMEVGWGRDEQETLLAAWSAARPAVVQPKLLAVLDEIPPPEQLSQVAMGQQSAAEPYRAALLRLATRKNLGPVVFAGPGGYQAQFDEISAAIRAM